MTDDAWHGYENVSQINQREHNLCVCVCYIAHGKHTHGFSNCMTRASKHGLKLGQKVPRRTYSSYFWWQTACICSRIGSFTMMLWSEQAPSGPVPGPAVCLWLADNDIMSVERADIKWRLQGKSSEVIWSRTRSGHIWRLLKLHIEEHCVPMPCSPAMHAASAIEIKLLFWRNKEHGWIELELVPWNLEKSGNSSKVAARWLDSSVAKAVVTCKWLRAGAGTSRLMWPLQRKSGSAPRRTSWSAESETSGRPRWRTPSRRTSGPVEEARAAVGSAWEDHGFTFWVSYKTPFSFPDDSKKKFFFTDQILRFLKPLIKLVLGILPLCVFISKFVV